MLRNSPNVSLDSSSEVAALNAGGIDAWGLADRIL